MKATLFLIAFTAFTAAAPQPKLQPKPAAATPKRCGGASNKQCPQSAICVGEKEIKGGVGVCLANPKPCGNFFGDVCPNKTDVCISDPRIQCPPGAMDCGGGVCLPGVWAKQFGLKTN
ncbi:hypothetical protein MYSTI_04045 [Myxococcus stipitatus DSM 14675]|uniref:Dickkopf N-terminal cysteine-rich domain-containing protein n=1 Tax=Myxococcus stipitatus (strain DSM 14675 / JCM 12634 / Mx s8) TaxID=1278073 RepID=L7U8T8_MYXSD|nr:hypothetical protein [Myxococcus stipitatus]AGC45346.1 hypothetical protein MYSTI_04045 [Myxococcus stipitatus DSM 14675]